MNELLHFSLCLLALNGFALTKFTHFRDVFSRRPTHSQQKQLLALSWISILLSLLLSVLHLGAYGSLLFCGYMAVSLLFIMFFYSFKVLWVKAMSVVNITFIIMSGLFLAIF